MNIIFFNAAPLSFGGGAELTFVAMIEKLIKNGHTLNIITFDKSSIYIYGRLVSHHKIIWKYYIEKRIDDANIYEISITALFPFTRSYKQILNLISNSDIIYTKNEIHELIILNYFIKNCKKSPPIICGIHTPVFYPSERSVLSRLHNILYGRVAYGKLLDMSSVILTQNTFDTKLLTSRYQIDKSKIMKLLPFIDTDLFSFKNIKRTDDKFKVLFVGRLNEQKGIDILFKSIEYISKLSEFNDMNFTIAGSGELDYVVKELSKKYNNVKFIGYIPNKELNELYNSHDVIILPSRWETALKVVLEAQSCGLPAIVSDIAGPNELIIPNKTGFLLKPENEIDLTEKILTFFKLKTENMSRFNEFKKDSVRNAKNYSIGIVIIKIEKLFYQLKK